MRIGGFHRWAVAVCAAVVCAWGAPVAGAATGDAFLETAKVVAPNFGANAESSGGSFGSGVALSDDGTTAVVGAFQDEAIAGAAYVYTRTGTTWTLQAKLVPPASGSNRETGQGNVGESVAISADGNTVLLGGFGNATNVGAAWVYVRAGTTWTLQKRLTAPTSGADQEVGAGEFGTSVNLSADGNTALVGGTGDNTFVGAAWTFTRSGTTWTEQQKLTAPTTGADAGIGSVEFSSGAALSSDGKLAVIGGDGDDTGTGAAWAFSDAGGSWIEQAKLTAPTTGADAAVGASGFGSGVALSADGGDALVGGSDDNAGLGAGWVFAHSGATWTEGAKLTAPTSGTDAETSSGRAGSTVVLAADGATAILGALEDNGGTGAAFQFFNTGTNWAFRHKLAPPPGPDAAFGPAIFGAAMALSRDGDTLVLGGWNDDDRLGAIWSYAPTPLPRITGLAPASGPIAGGTPVAIHGSGFTATGNDAVQSVTVAGIPALSFTVISATEIDAVTPAHAAGVADVIVTAPAGTTAIGAADEFTYLGPVVPGPVPTPTAGALPAPTRVTATAGHGRARVTFRASSAAKPPTYTVTASPGGARASGSASPITVTRLHNGTRYTFRVTAADAGATSPASAASNPVTPFAPSRASKLSVMGVATRHPALMVTVSAGRGSPRLKSISIRLPKGLGFVRRALAGRVLLGGQRLHQGKRVRGALTLRHGRLSIVLARPSAAPTVTLPRSTLTATGALAHAARRRGRIALALTVVDTAGNSSTLKPKVRLR